MSEPKDLTSIIPDERIHEKKLRFYHDKECQEPFSMEFMTPVIAGETDSMKVYAKNVTPEKLYRLKIESGDPDLKIEASDENIAPYGIIELTVTFSPSKTRKESLNSKFTVSGLALAKRKLMRETNE